MAYEILEFQFGTGKPQGYVLRGTGEHEGTDLSLSLREVDGIIARASRSSPHERAAFANELDLRFLLKHADRQLAIAACLAVADFARAIARPAPGRLLIGMVDN